jgi:hypothetical protein
MIIATTAATFLRDRQRKSMVAMQEIMRKERISRTAIVITGMMIVIGMTTEM